MVVGQFLPSRVVDAAVNLLESTSAVPARPVPSNLSVLNSTYGTSGQKNLMEHLQLSPIDFFAHD